MTFYNCVSFLKYVGVFFCQWFVPVCTSRWIYYNSSSRISVKKKKKNLFVTQNFFQNYAFFCLMWQFHKKSYFWQHGIMNTTNQILWTMQIEKCSYAHVLHGKPVLDCLYLHIGTWVIFVSCDAVSSACPYLSYFNWFCSVCGLKWGTTLRYATNKAKVCALS